VALFAGSSGAASTDVNPCDCNTTTTTVPPTTSTEPPTTTTVVHMDVAPEVAPEAIVTAPRFTG
jgi:hypothetical protein